MAPKSPRHITDEKGNYCCEDYHCNNIRLDNVRDKDKMRNYDFSYASRGMWESYWLIYIRRGFELEAFGILEAPDKRRAIRRAWRNEWEYAKEKNHAWRVGEFPEVSSYADAVMSDWWGVIDAHRSRRIPPDASVLLERRRQALGSQSTPPTGESDRGETFRRFLRETRWRERY